MMTLTQYISARMPNASQGEVATHLGMSRPYLNLILSGQRVPGPKMQSKIYQATGGVITPNDWACIVPPDEFGAAEEADDDPAP